MQATLETLEGLERKLRIVVPADELEEGVEKKLKEAAGQVRLNGFRPGKVPMREVRRRFGEGIRQEVGSELMNANFMAAVAQQSVVPAGTPRIEEVVLAHGEDLQFTALFEVFPEVTVAGFEALEIEQPVATIGESDLEDMIESLRSQRTTFNPVERDARVGDKVNIDFVGSVDGETFEGGAAEGSDLELGSGSMIPGFEDGIVGHNAGAKLNLNVTFPEDYQAAELSGKDASFEVTINTVSESTLPALDDEFFKQFGVEEGGVEAFRSEVRSNMQKELDTAIKNRVKQQVMDGLAEANKIDVPTALVDGEIDHIRRDTVQRFGGNQEIDPSILPAEMFRDQALRRVTLGLIVKAIVEQADLEVDEAEVRKTIENLASSYENPEAIVSFYYGNEAQLSQVENMVLEQQVVDHVLEQAQVTDKVMTYKEVTQPPAPALPAPQEEEQDARQDEAEATDSNSATTASE